MRSIILLIVVSLIFIASVFAINRSHEYFYIFNFCIVPCIVAALFLTGREAFMVTVASSLLGISLKFIGIGIDNLFNIAVFLSIGTTCAYYMKAITDRSIFFKERVLQVIKEEYRASYEFSRRSENDKVYLEKSVYDISSLYQAPKKMISSLKSEELLEVLRKSIEGYFNFKSCRIIIFSFKETKPKIEKVYNIPQKSQEAQGANKHDETLMAIMENRTEPLIIDKGINTGLPEGLILDDGVDTFVAVPLSAGERIIGILAIENISIDDIVRFMIMSHQFAMVLERIRLYELVQELAITDGLTGLFVRRYFMERLTEEIDRAGYFNTRLSFLMIDIDNFKACNDRYGHLVGDAVLKGVADIMKKSLREIDIIGRYGGEEFSVIMPDTLKADALVAGERLRNTLKKSKIRAYDESINISISGGIASFPDDTGDLNQLIDRADQMLYKAKAEGKNSVKAYGSA